MSRTRTEILTELRPSISNREQLSRDKNQTPTIDDQIRNYRRGHRIRQEIQR
jgi:hypothetical protein